MNLFGGRELNSLSRFLGEAVDFKTKLESPAMSYYEAESGSEPWRSSLFTGFTSGYSSCTGCWTNTFGILAIAVNACCSLVKHDAHLQKDLAPILHRNLCKGASVASKQIADRSL